MSDTQEKNSGERIGVLLVHGIGDQSRNEHLQSVASNFVNVAALVFGRDNVSIQMFPGLNGKSDLSIIINDKGNIKVLDLVEVWWRDLGQRRNPFTVTKFWLWAATFSGTRGRFFAENELTVPPKNKTTQVGHVRLADRIILFFKITYFFILLFPLRISVLILHFIPGMDRVNLFNTVFTYLSSVQLYQERQGSRGGTLVDFDQSRRISIQRRFANAVVDMAERNFDRWYVVGHSLGSVIALKGLMYPEEAWARFMSCDRWFHKNMRFRSKLNVITRYPDRPRKPTWLGDDDGVDTSKLLEKCAGLLTWGSPLETFARTWPGMVHLNQTPKLPSGFEWINIYDQVDIIASKLTSFDKMKPKNILSKSSSLIFSAHTAYLKPRKKETECVARAVLGWMLDGKKPFNTVAEERRFFPPSPLQQRIRRFFALTQWAIVLIIGLFVWPVSINFFLKTLLIVPQAVAGFVAEASYSIRGYRESLWVHVFRHWSNNTVDFLKSLQPTLDLSQDIFKLFEIILVVAFIVVVGSFLHNMRDLYIHLLSQRKKMIVNKEVSIAEYPDNTSARSSSQNLSV